MSGMTQRTASRRQVLTLGLKALAVVVPVAAVLVSKPSTAEAYTTVVRRRRRRWWY